MCRGSGDFETLEPALDRERLVQADHNGECAFAIDFRQFDDLHVSHFADEDPGKFHVYRHERKLRGPGERLFYRDRLDPSGQVRSGKIYPFSTPMPSMPPEFPGYGP